MRWLGPNISELGEGQFAVNTVIHHRVTQNAGNILIICVNLNSSRNRWHGISYKQYIQEVLE